MLKRGAKLLRKRKMKENYHYKSGFACNYCFLNIKLQFNHVYRLKELKICMYSKLSSGFKQCFRWAETLVKLLKLEHQKLKNSAKKM